MHRRLVAHFRGHVEDHVEVGLDREPAVLEDLVLELPRRPTRVAERHQVLPGATWVAAGVARFQWEVNQWCLETGGHCRTGLEDNLKIEQNRLAASNAELVKKIADNCAQYGRRPATPAEARQILGLRAAA